MIKNKNEIPTIEEDFEIADESVAWKVFRNFINTNEPIKWSKDIAIKNYREIASLYDALTDIQKKIMDNLIRNLLEEKYINQLFKEFFKCYIKENNISLPKLSKFIYAKNQCDYKCGKINIGEDLDTVNRKIQNFAEISVPQNNSLGLSELCTILSIDLEVLTKGEGIVYSIDETYLYEEIEKQNIDKTELFNRVFEKYINCFRCKYINSCEIKEDYVAYMKYDVKSLAEIIAQILQIDTDKIVQKNDIYIELDYFPAEHYFRKLKEKEQKAVLRLICDLHMIVK